MNDLPLFRTLYLCRPEFSDALFAEMQEGCAGTIRRASPAPGLLLIESSLQENPEAFIFERQRLVNPVLIPASDLKPIIGKTVEAVFQSIIREHPLWTVHLLTVEEGNENEAKPTGNLEGIWKTLLRLAKKAAPDIEKRQRAPHRLKPGGLVLQLLMTREGLWCAMERVEDMRNSKPGGFSRMKRDPLAPSRSYLKIEEALDWLPSPPVPGDRVIDLGAAPGGWTYAFVRRGCDVLSVDHGPMKLPEPRDGWGSMQHIRENGITFEPPDSWNKVNWLVADMLIAPGVALGLLRRWISSGKAEHIICNIKLPQSEPYQALRPIMDMLNRQETYGHRIKQLYHDRREVTVIAWKQP